MQCLLKVPKVHVFIQWIWQPGCILTSCYSNINVSIMFKKAILLHLQRQRLLRFLTMDFSCSGFMAGSCCASRQALWKRSKKAVRSADGSQAGTSQNRSEMIAPSISKVKILTQLKWHFHVKVHFHRIPPLYKNVALTWTWKVRPRTKLLMLCLKLTWYFCNAGFIYLKKETCDLLAWQHQHDHVKFMVFTVIF